VHVAAPGVDEIRVQFDQYTTLIGRSRRMLPTYVVTQRQLRRAAGVGGLD
jgi:hypothetical protein